jgi:integral membrane protein
MKATPLLGWYRALAIATGVALLVFCGFMVAKYGFGKAEEVTTYVAMLHGYLYIGYFVVTFLLGQKLKWPLGRLVLTLAAGCIPFLSFVFERKVAGEATAKLTAGADPRQPAGV